MDVTAERRLWCAVVNQAVTEALWPRPIKNGGSSGISHLDKHLARRWLGSRDFRLVCSLAGYDPDFIMDAISPILGDTKAGERFIVRLNGRIRRGRPRRVGSPVHA